MSLVVVVVTEADKGARVDQFLARSRPELSRARVQALIEAGHVRIAGKPIKASLRVQGEEQIELEVPAPVAAEPEAEDLPLSVVFQDRDIAVLCHHGMRSLQVADYLQSKGLNRLYNLTGGIAAWAEQVDPAMARY